MTFEEFDKKYREHVTIWFKSKRSTFPLDNISTAEDFYSELYMKLFEKNNIEKFNPELGVAFKSWLEIVMNHLYIDLYKRETYEVKTNEIKYSLLEKDSPETIRIKEQSLDDIIDNRATEKNIYYKNQNISRTEDKEYENLNLLDTIFQQIEVISKINNRVLVKLKLFNHQFINFNEQEYQYMETHSSMDKEEIIDFLNENMKPHFGLRNEDIVKLTEYKADSISTLYKRIVSKLNSDSYKS